jgi:hypothetical protein
MPVQLPSTKQYTLFSIELREPVAYRLEQIESLLLVHLTPLPFLPPPADEANLPAWKKALEKSVGPVEIPSESSDVKLARWIQWRVKVKRMLLGSIN